MPLASDDYAPRGSGSALASSPHSRIPVRPPLRRMPASRSAAATPSCAFTSPVGPQVSTRMVSSPAHSPHPGPAHERTTLSPRTPTASRMPRSPRLIAAPAARHDSPSSAFLVPASPAAAFSPLRASGKSTPMALRRPPAALRPAPPSPALSAASHDSSRSGGNGRSASPLPQPMLSYASSQTPPTSRIPATPRMSLALRPRDGNVPTRRLSPSAPPLKELQSPAMVSSASQTTPVRSRLPVSPSRRVPAPLFIHSPEIAQVETEPVPRTSNSRESPEAALTMSADLRPSPARMSADTGPSSLQRKALPEEPKEESIAPLLVAAQHTDALLRSRRMRTTSEGAPHGGSQRGSATFSPARSSRRLAKLRALPMFSHTRQASNGAPVDDSAVASPTLGVGPEHGPGEAKASSSAISSFVESVLHHAQSATTRSRKRASHGDDAFLGAGPGRRRGAAGRTLSGSHQPFTTSTGTLTKLSISAPIPAAEGVAFPIHPSQAEAKLAAAPQLRGSPSLPELRTVATITRSATSVSATKRDGIEMAAQGSPSRGFGADDPRRLWLSSAPRASSIRTSAAQPVARAACAPEPHEIAVSSTPSSPATSVGAVPTLSPATSRPGSVSATSLSPATPARYMRYRPAAALTKQGLVSLEAELESDVSLTPKLRRPARFPLAAYQGNIRAPGADLSLDAASHDGSVSFDETRTSITSECPSLTDSEAESVESHAIERVTSTSLPTATQSPNLEAPVHACILQGLSSLSESPEALVEPRKATGGKYCFEVLNAESSSADACGAVVADAHGAFSPALYELSSVEGSDAESEASDDDSIRESVGNLQDLLTQASRKLEAHCSPQTRASSLEAAGARAQAARPGLRASIRRSHARGEGQREEPQSVELPPEGLELRIVDDEHGGPPRLELSWEIRMSGTEGHRSVAGRTLVPEAVSASLFASWASTTGLGPSPAQRQPSLSRDAARLTGGSVYSEWSAISSAPSLGELELQQLQASAQAQLQASREWGLQPARERHLSHPVQESPSLLGPTAWAASSPRSPSFFPRPLLLSRPSNERRRTREESAPAETQSTHMARASQRSAVAAVPAASPSLLDLAASRRSRQGTTPRSTRVPIGTPRSTVPSSPGATLGYLPRPSHVGPSPDASINVSTLSLLQRAAESCIDLTPRSRRPALPRTESIESALMDTRPPFQILTASSSLAEITGAGN